MTMTPGEIEHKVRQLDDDVQAIHVMLHDISATQSRHGNRLETIDGRLGGIDGRLGGIDGRLEGLERSMAEVLRRLPER